jgi:hypothetical protein
VLNVVTDMYLMSIPMPMLWKASLETRKKLSLIVIFGGGVFVMMAGILRCALIIQVSSDIMIPHARVIVIKSLTQSLRIPSTAPKQLAAGRAVRHSSPSSSATYP